MPILTDYSRNLLARALCARVPSLPANAFAALGTGGGGASGLTGEPVGNGYTRQRVVFTGTGQQRNAEALRFVFSGAVVGTLTHVGLFDAVSGGNALTYAPLTAPVAVTGAGAVTIAVDGLSVTGD